MATEQQQEISAMDFVRSTFDFLQSLEIDEIGGAPELLEEAQRILKSSRSEATDTNESVTHAEGELTNGWGAGVTGPTVPNISGATVGEACAYDDWVAAGEKEGQYPPRTSKVITQGDVVIAIVPENGHGEANAARLVHCWNTHDELVEALEDLAHEAENVGEENCILVKRIVAARSAITKARVEA